MARRTLSRTPWSTSSSTDWLFADTPDGAKANAVFYSLVRTAIANDIDPYKYPVHSFPDLSLASWMYKDPVDEPATAGGVGGEVAEGLILCFGLLGARLATYEGLLLPFTVFLLCFIMGLQNAVVTKLSGAVIRTTHLGHRSKPA